MNITITQLRKIQSELELKPKLEYCAFKAIAEVLEKLYSKLKITDDQKELEALVFSLTSGDLQTKAIQSGIQFGEGGIPVFSQVKNRFTAGVMEYIAAELLEISSLYAERWWNTKIHFLDVVLGVKNDKELSEFVSKLKE